MDAGITLLDLASKANILYDAQPFLERRRLLNYVFSNSTWKNGKLTPTYRQPFDMLADANIAYQNKMTAGVTPNGHFDEWLPVQDLPKVLSDNLPYIEDLVLPCIALLFGSKERQPEVAIWAGGLVAIGPCGFQGGAKTLALGTKRSKTCPKCPVFREVNL